jgi:hypothetical protein
MCNGLHQQQAFRALRKKGVADTQPGKKKAKEKRIQIDGSWHPTMLLSNAKKRIIKRINKTDTNRERNKRT